jgi:hypothetical protein
MLQLLGERVEPSLLAIDPVSNQVSDVSTGEVM